jgi:hypothetical protein
VHYAEVEVAMSGMLLEADFIVVDEFITRMLVEDPEKVKDRMENKMHLGITINQKNVNAFRSAVKGLKVIRSMELVTISYELGLLNDYAKVPVKNCRRELLEAVLWGVKLNGCSGMTKEIDEILKIEGF